MRLAITALLMAPASLSQSFVNVTGAQLPGGPGNDSSTGNVDFADVDLDGDYDVLCANGVYDADERNRLWINQGGVQGGTPGFFVDQTLTQLPFVLDTSWDVEFADVDADGDPDAIVSNITLISTQSSRILINQGGAQGGTAGFFVDFSHDSGLGDLDGDGDLDLVHSGGRAFVDPSDPPADAPRGSGNAAWDVYAPIEFVMAP